MMNRNRRQFLADVGRGMLVASVGSALAADLGLAPSFAKETAGRLTFGDLEPLVGLIQDTPPAKLLPILVEKVKAGTELRTLVAATALANARTCGGHDYDGYHAFMALTPSFHMSKEMPAEKSAVPVLKVIYRNCQFIQNFGGSPKESLHPVEPMAEVKGPEAVREATRSGDSKTAERALVGLAGKSLDEAYEAIQMVIQDDIDVHRVVLAWRSWATLDLTGREQAATLLRQSVQFCNDSEQSVLNKRRAAPGVRATLPKLLDQYKLQGRALGKRKGDDAWTEALCQAIYAGSRDQAAEAVAAALAEGFSPEDVGEAISLAANRLVLRDPGRNEKQTQAGKPLGSVHGASVGVHASDSANAWRNIARVNDGKNAVANLIVAGYHTAGQAGWAGAKPYPQPEHLNLVKAKDAKGLLGEAEEAIKSRDQVRACAAIHRYGELGASPRPVFDLMLKYACSEDGALHAEKYYRTVSEEFAITRPAFRWRQLVGLARVTASEHGYPAAGYADICRLLKV